MPQDGISGVLTNIVLALLILEHECGACVELLAGENASDYLQKTLICFNLQESK
jgi:hypothetical protein